MSAHLQTPRRANVRPSLAHSNISTASSPALNFSHAQRTALERKASLNALTGSSPSKPPDAPAEAMLGGDGQPLGVGDEVDVPGGMHGVVKFVGNVRGKKGVFAGVELAREFAARGKNGGDVDGVRYFTTSVSGAGIFLPLHRASKRASFEASEDSLPPTPSTPASLNLGSTHDQHEGPSSPTPPMPKFSQSVGPGARASSPKFKQTRGPSLPRPESPLRQPPKLAPTPSRTTTPARNLSLTPGAFSKSQIGAPKLTPSPAPSKIVKSRTPQPRKVTAPPTTSRITSRANSRLASTTDEDDDAVSEDRHASVTAAEQEVERLQKRLEEREKQLREQAASLADMESALVELQTLLPADGELPPRNDEFEDADVAHLRALLREKNEKISMLTAEFDMHRADFRSTIDTLELASSETVRVYEQRVEDLMAEVRELHERSEDVDSVAEQLKQLEELVQELEEGLEDARRGEAEARGEVEFLRGEVERGRSELRREREKAAAALKGATAAADGGPLSPGGTSREVEQRDDEIRGLKAIIHSLSSGGDMASPGAELSRSPLSPPPNDPAITELRASLERVERENQELRGLVDRKTFREEELERELERLRTQAGDANPARDSVISNAQSERTAQRDSKSTVVSWRGYQKEQQTRRSSEHHQKQLASMPESEDGNHSSASQSDELWCEICETGGHDILNCTNDLGAAANKHQEAQLLQAPNEHHNELHLTASHQSGLSLLSGATSDDEREHRLEAERAAAGAIVTPDPTDDLSASTTDIEASPTPLRKPAASPTPAPAASLPNPYEDGLVAGKGQEVDADKWCALCERDGHDATACPFDDVL